MRPTFVYRLFDAAGQLLYVGCAYDPKSRLRQHRLTQPWAGEIDRMETISCADRAKALSVEAGMIAAEMPRWNVLGKPRPPAERPTRKRPKPEPVAARPGPLMTEDEFVAQVRARRVASGQPPHITDPAVYRVLDALMHEHAERQGRAA